MGILPDEASPEHVAALDDGKITEEEYTAGYRRFVACVRDAGQEVIEHGRPSTLYEISVSGDADGSSGAFDECYYGEWSAIDSIWQYENPPWTVVGDKIIACLEDAGLPTDGNENELKERMIENDLDIRECVGT